ncbi:pyridoxal-dependent decarboxylase-like protein [Lutibacter oceani]|uniref:Pyridoxal-dependent decarboxylase-like protein n=1 Tax=Lutibacter oceani TaxID=1853311 RepID=A0A3D9S0K7_9FLAO|nr:pyridoxal-dependent decarboxylase [Lutibacter oceani]REE83364.1 pyridoxal-dependent decarboxylase-like protein [Lutibacter oceani]
MKYWKKYSKEKLIKRIDKALESTIDFQNSKYLGYPVSRLDENVFNTSGTFLNNSPLLKSFIANPNNIGCHTLGKSEEAFKGSQELEKEVIRVLAVDIFKAKENEYDGYIATGGTEANIQALWIYRNLYKKEFDATLDEMVILSSEDTHYSVHKGSNLLSIDTVSIPVDFNLREIIAPELDNIVKKLISEGKKYFMVISNMATTMFGSVDNPDIYAEILSKYKVKFKIHIDGAFGGFIYPISNRNSTLNFENPNISSITIDAHKMLQAPYGTGVFLCRKGLIENVLTKEAQYVDGMDLTIVGSRSGANAIAVWMILFSYGYYGWFEKINTLLLRTDWFAKQLDALNIEYFRDPFMNIVTIKSEYVPEKLAHKYGLVPDTHSGKNSWYKVIMMDHVEIDDLLKFVEELTNISIS